MKVVELIRLRHEIVLMKYYFTEFGAHYYPHLGVRTIPLSTNHSSVTATAPNSATLSTVLNKNCCNIPQSIKISGSPQMRLSQ